MGEVFAGRYELVDPIGHGGVGAVWRAWDHRRRRYVAAKVLQQRDAHALLRFVREQATRIDHPHVLAPASWAADDDKVLFTMDLVRGGSLAHLVGDYGPLPPRYVVVLLDQLLAGLTAVHAEGVVHRDIKPANILLEATGTGTPHVRLSDFGIAMRKGDARLTETNYVVGTPGYFAPEQLMGAEPDFTADLYAVGLVALYLLGGRKPDAEAIQERFLAMGMPPAPLEVPEPLWQVVGALLQPDPHARFRTATGARKALGAAIELIPEGAPGEEPVEIFDLIGALPDGFGPEGPPTSSRPSTPFPAPSPDPFPARSRDNSPTPFPASAPFPAAPSTSVSGSGPAPASAPSPSAVGTAAPRTPRTPSAPVPAGSPEVPPARPESEESATGFPLSPPRPVHQPTPHPPAPPALRPQGRHAAPLPAHEPLTHTRTRAEQSAPPAQQQPLPQPLPAAPPPHPHAHPAPGEDTASAQLPARAPRPGPPARIAVPVLLIAALCFAIGILALLAS